MEQGEQEGMQSFDAVLEGLIRKGLVRREEALPYATNQNNLVLRLADFGGGGNRSPSAESSAQSSGGSGTSMLDLLE
jgi:Tfp pilus assembly ATPase PilU